MKWHCIIALLFFTFCYAPLAWSTHNRAGEITYEQTGPLTIRMTLTTYTKTSSVSADRDSVEIFWGDGTSDVVVRANGNGFPIANDIKINKYIAEHTYPGRATYTIGFGDPNRVANILNVNYPNSVDVEFFLSTTLTLLDPQFQGPNNSAILLQPPVDVACVNKKFIHNPGAWDPDGDSLSYELVVPRMSAEEEVPGYLFPDEIGAGPLNHISLDPVTGDFTWETPQIQGEYNIAIRINEWRNGLLITSMIRDMQILVAKCDNEPPVIFVEDELCVVAGEEINLDVLVDDPDAGQKVLIEASGGPFELDSSSALLLDNPGLASPPYHVNLKWSTGCNHISDQYYQIILRAVDNYYGDSIGLAVLKTIRIKVVGPPPEDLTADVGQGKLKLSWSLPYDCEDIENDYFQGFSVWRRIGSNIIPRDTCFPGLEGKGYQKIIYNTTQKVNGRYIAEDGDVEKGVTYCYRIVAEFAKQSSTGNPFNRVESLASDEVCVQLARDLPVITKVSIDHTDKLSGIVHVRWEKPRAEDLDTTANPGPYKYEFYRSTGDGNFELLPDFTIETPFLATPVDTEFFDSNVNTVDSDFTYRIHFFTGGSLYGMTPGVSSPFLSLMPTDEKIFLSWTQDVPWSKKYFDVYLLNDQGEYDFLETVQDHDYTHDGLDNDSVYCYKIKAVGSYDIQGIEDPLVNWSQEVCSAPNDNIPPCPPTLEVQNVCNEDFISENPEELVNKLIFSRPNIDCEETDDVQGYYIYFGEIEGDDLAIIDTIADPDVNRYLHNPERGISGCYAVSAYDVQGNQSPLSNIVCVDNCPEYKLPNTFTPNGDGSNDVFVPIINQFIESVHFEVFNEWGNKVFSTDDPALEWRGVDFSGKDLSAGTYYYVCKVFEQRVSGVQGGKVLRGYIHLIR